MPLSKTQLMSIPGGPGVVGAVKAGNGISVSADGSVSVNSSQTITQIIAGAGVSINPTSGFGAVTISATGSGGTVTSVGVSGGSTGLTFSGSPVTTSGTITLGGVLGIANGGTGATSTAGLQTAVFPAQGGQNGKFLTTNGTVVTWATPPQGTITGITTGTGLSGGGTSGDVTLNNTGVVSLSASNGITASASTGTVALNFNVADLPSLPL